MSSELPAGLQRRLDEIRQTQERLRQLHEETSRAYGWAASADKLVSCTVTASEGLTDLHIDPSALRAYRAPDLAAAVVETVRAANEQLQSHLREQYQDVLGDTVSAESLLDPTVAEEEILRRKPTHGQ